MNRSALLSLATAVLAALALPATLSRRSHHHRPRARARHRPRGRHLVPGVPGLAAGGLQGARRGRHRWTRATSTATATTTRATSWRSTSARRTATSTSASTSTTWRSAPRTATSTSTWPSTPPRAGRPTCRTSSTATTDRPWELCVNVYQAGTVYGSDYRIYDQNWTNVTDAYLGAYFNSQLDAVEFGITRQALLNAGWNGSSALTFQVLHREGRRAPRCCAGGHSKHHRRHRGLTTAAAPTAC